MTASPRPRSRRHPQTTGRKGAPAWPAFAVLGLLLLLAVEPALANRFETVSSSFSGSSLVKRTWLERFLVITGGISLFTGILAIVVPHRHAAFLNFGNWKQSALVLFAFAGVLWMLALLL